MLTHTQLSQIMCNAAPAKCQSFLAPLNDAMEKHGITSLLRTAAFIAQLAHESGEFRFMEELWGPTAAQKRYEPACDLANRLGNTQAGDGKRFKGRGPIQITGRFNYKKYGDMLGIDLTAEPERAATPEIGFATAGLFWERNDLNELADAGDFKAITRRINGGQNGAAERERFFELAKRVLAPAVPAVAVTRTREAVKAKGAAGDERAKSAFGRGYEELKKRKPRTASASKSAVVGKTAEAKLARPARKRTNQSNIRERM